MLKQPLILIFERELNRLKEEINLYADENKLWIVDKNIINSAGNLTLHLIGNLNHFIGAVLGNTGYIRDRDKEFSDKNVSREKIVMDIDSTINMVKHILSTVSDEVLTSQFPEKKQGQEHPTSFILLHILAHLEYHLGQINYHRRLIP